MTDVQLYIGIGLPVIAVLASLTVSLVQISGIREDFRVQISAIREDLREVRSDVRGEISTIREEVREIRSGIREIRSDIKLLTGKVYELMSEKH